MLKSGQESFQFEGKTIPVDLLNFWQWSHSDLLSNTLRGQLAEFIVSTAIGLENTQRIEWDAYDLQTLKGLKIEVKSSAYLQSWIQKKESLIRFGISETLGWDATTNTYASAISRQTNLYVFCLYTHKDKLTANPLDLDHWLFYLLPTTILNQHLPQQKTISLSRLLKFKPVNCGYGQLKSRIGAFEIELLNKD